MAKKIPSAKMFGHKLRRARLLNEWTLDDVAEKTKVVRSTISLYELGNISSPDQDIMRTLAKVYNIDYISLIITLMGDRYLTVKEMETLSVYIDLKRIEQDRKQMNTDIQRIEAIISKIRPNSD